MAEIKYDLNAIMKEYGDDDFDVSFSREVLRRGYQLWVTNKNYYGGVI